VFPHHTLLFGVPRDAYEAYVAAHTIFHRRVSRVIRTIIACVAHIISSIVA